MQVYFTVYEQLKRLLQSVQPHDDREISCLKLDLSLSVSPCGPAGQLCRPHGFMVITCNFILSTMLSVVGASVLCSAFSLFKYA